MKNEPYSPVRSQVVAARLLASPSRLSSDSSPRPARYPAGTASTDATGSTPGNSCGKGSMPSARSLSSFARLTASSSSAIAEQPSRCAA